MTDELRPSKEFKTPIDGHSVVIKEYLTGRETRDVENTYIDASKAVADPDGKRPVLTGAIANQAQNKI